MTEESTSWQGTPPPPTPSPTSPWQRNITAQLPATHISVGSSSSFLDLSGVFVFGTDRFWFMLMKIIREKSIQNNQFKENKRPKIFRVIQEQDLDYLQFIQIQFFFECFVLGIWRETDHCHILLSNDEFIKDLVVDCCSVNFGGRSSKWSLGGNGQVFG